jgi:hypothetical protein
MRPPEYTEQRFYIPTTGEEISLSIYWDKQPVAIEQTLIDFPVYTLLRAWHWTAEVWFEDGGAKWMRGLEQPVGYFVASGFDRNGSLGEVVAANIEELVQSAIKQFGDE